MNRSISIRGLKNSKKDFEVSVYFNIVSPNHVFVYLFYL